MARVTRKDRTSGRDQPVTVRMARWSAHRPRRAVAGWVVFVALCVAVGAATGTNQGTMSAFWIGEAGRAEAMATAAGVGPQETEQILIAATAGPLDEVAAAAAAADVDTALRAVPGVADVGRPVRSADASTLRVPVTLAGTGDEARKGVRLVLPRVAELQADHPRVRITQTGSPSISVGSTPSRARTSPAPR